MADKVRKLKDAAAQMMAKGRVEKALEYLAEVVRLEPQDLPSRQRCGDLYRKLGHNAKAIEAYQAVAGAYAADGLLLKAIAVCKVILQIDKDHTETQRILAELYGRKRGTSTQAEIPATMAAAITGTLPRTTTSALRGVSSAAIAAFAGARNVDPSVEPLPAVQGTLEDSGPTVDASTAMAGIGIDMGFGGVTPASRTDDGAIELDLEPLPTVAAPASAAATPGDDAISFADDVIEGEEIELELVTGAPMPPPEPQTVDLAELPPIPLFSDLSKAAFVGLLERLALRHLEPGEIVVRQGEVGDACFIIASGAVRVVHDGDGGSEIELARLGEGSFFGEMALLGDGRRAASVIGDGAVELLELSRDTLQAVIAEHPSVKQVMARFHKQRLLANLLSTSPVFAPFGREQRKQLIEKFKSREIAPGTEILSEGQKGDGLYVLLSGRCEVSRHLDGRRVVLAELGAGDVFGEMSLLERSPVSASITTQGTCIVLRLPAKSFNEVIVTYPQILEKVLALSDARAATNVELLGTAPATSDDMVRV
ncbi:MAG: cyclic nucleotide-binding domain-containing protein [Pseudomonadota bacterium]